MKRIYAILLKPTLCFLIGCTAIPTATDKNQTLLVGEVIFVGSDYVSNNGISFNGTTTSGIEIVLRNTSNNESFRISTNNTGLFHINLQDGKYMIDELYVKKERNDGAWSYLYTSPSQKVMEIEKGKVNNIGTIRWSYLERKHNVIQTDNSLAVKNNFSKKFPKSNWNQKEWEYSKLMLETRNYSGETVTYYIKTDDGRDSTRITVPKEMPETSRRNIEQDMKKVMSYYRSQGDTAYYVKSENGLDSVLLRLPKAMPEEQKRVAEENIKRHLRENRLQRESSDSIREMRIGVNAIVSGQKIIED